MPDSQSKEPRFESTFATVSKFGIIVLYTTPRFTLSCINEYQTEVGIYMRDSRVNRRMARILPREVELVLE